VKPVRYLREAERDLDRHAKSGQAVADVHTYARLARRPRTPIESLIRDRSRRTEAEAAE
jgi:hypothetical protein